MKAQQLVNDYKRIVYPYVGSGMLTNSEDEGAILENARTCARITVEEIILALELADTLATTVQFWESIFKDIDKTV